MTMWKVDRKTLLNVATDMVLNRNYQAEHLSNSMADWHYRGKSKPRAAAIFYRDLKKLWGQLRYKQLTQQIAKVNQMADELKAEGWRFLPSADGNSGGCWYHDQAGSVNSQGAGFPSFEAATIATYNSAVRQLHCVANNNK